MEDQYVVKSDCERTHKSDEAWKKEVTDGLRELNNRLYRDNGHISIQTRLDRGDRILGVLCWVTSIAGGAIILATMAFLFKLIVLFAGK
jgi:hypothetical protein